MRCKACNIDTNNDTGLCAGCYVYSGDIVKRDRLDGTPQATFAELVQDYGLEESWATEKGLGLVSRSKLYTNLYNNAFNRFLDNLEGGFTPKVAFERSVLRKLELDRFIE